MRAQPDPQLRRARRVKRHSGPGERQPHLTITGSPGMPGIPGRMQGTHRAGRDAARTAVRWRQHPRAGPPRRKCPAHAARPPARPGTPARTRSRRPPAPHKESRYQPATASGGGHAANSRVTPALGRRGRGQPPAGVPGPRPRPVRIARLRVHLHTPLGRPDPGGPPPPGSWSRRPRAAPAAPPGSAPRSARTRPRPRPGPPAPRRPSRAPARPRHHVIGQPRLRLHRQPPGQQVPLPPASSTAAPSSG